jgi:hypothetical protein
VRAPRLHYASAFRFITFEVKGGNSTAAAGTTLLPATGTLAVLLMLALTPGQPTLRLQVDQACTEVGTLELNGVYLPLLPCTVTQHHLDAVDALRTALGELLLTNNGQPVSGTRAKTALASLMDLAAAADAAAVADRRYEPRGTRGVQWDWCGRSGRLVERWIECVSIGLSLGFHLGGGP